MCDHEDLYRGIYEPLGDDLDPTTFNDAEIAETIRTLNITTIKDRAHLERFWEENVKKSMYLRSRGESVIKDQKWS